MSVEREINLGVVEQTPVKLKEPSVPHPKTVELIRTGIETGVFLNIDEEKRRIITAYYFTPGIKLIDLTSLVSPRTKKRVKEVIFSSLEEIWSGLPEDIRTKIPREEAIRLKHHSYSKEHRENISRWLKTDEVRRKLGVAAKQRGFPPNFERKRLEAIRGKKRPRNVRTKIKNTLRERWKEPEFSNKMREVFKISGMERSGRILWETAVSEDLITKMLEVGLLSSEEIEILRRGFKRKKPASLISRDLLDRFSIAVARVA